MTKQLTLDFSPRTEKDLITAAKTGDTKAFDKLWHMHKERLYVHCYNLTRSQSMAEEILQLTMIKAWNSLNNFRGDSTMFTWLHIIAKNLAITNFKRESRKRTVEVTVEDDYLNNLSNDQSRLDSCDHASYNETWEAVMEAVTHLSADHQKVFKLAIIQGLSYKEISALLKVPEETVRTRLFYARQALKDILHEYLMN